MNDWSDNERKKGEFMGGPGSGQTLTRSAAKKTTVGDSLVFVGRQGNFRPLQEDHRRRADAKPHPRGARRGLTKSWTFMYRTKDRFLFFVRSPIRPENATFWGTTASSSSTASFALKGSRPGGRHSGTYPVRRLGPFQRGRTSRSFHADIRGRAFDRKLRSALRVRSGRSALSVAFTSPIKPTSTG
jgi:hypothetical protein